MSHHFENSCSKAVHAAHARELHDDSILCEESRTGAAEIPRAKHATCQGKLNPIKSFLVAFLAGITNDRQDVRTGAGFQHASLCDHSRNLAAILLAKGIISLDPPCLNIYCLARSDHASFDLRKLCSTQFLSTIFQCDTCAQKFRSATLAFRKS